MRRRAFLATVGAATLTGCTASADGRDVEQYAVDGLEDSDIYHDSHVDDVFSVDPFYDQIVLALEFDPDSEYDPLENDVLLLDGHDTVATGEDESRLYDTDPTYVGFELDADAIGDRRSFRVVSKDAAGVIEEVEIEVVYRE